MTGQEIVNWAIKTKHEFDSRGLEIRCFILGPEEYHNLFEWFVVGFHGRTVYVESRSLEAPERIIGVDIEVKSTNGLDVGIRTKDWYRFLNPVSLDAKNAVE